MVRLMERKEEGGEKQKKTMEEVGGEGEDSCGARGWLAEEGLQHHGVADQGRGEGGGEAQHRGRRHHDRQREHHQTATKASQCKEGNYASTKPASIECADQQSL